MQSLLCAKAARSCQKNDFNSDRFVPSREKYYHSKNLGHHLGGKTFPKSIHDVHKYSHFKPQSRQPELSFNAPYSTGPFNGRQLLEVGLRHRRSLTREGLETNGLG